MRVYAEDGRTSFMIRCYSFIICIFDEQIDYKIQNIIIINHRNMDMYTNNCYVYALYLSSYLLPFNNICIFIIYLNTPIKSFTTIIYLTNKTIT